MGQYWIPVNLDKKEFVHPYAVDSGLKIWEQLASHPGTGAALIVLLAAEKEERGGGDLALNDAEWKKVKLPDDYKEIAKRTIGRWAGDRIAIVGDYAEDTDLDPQFQASKIFEACLNGEYKDISEDVARVIEYELGGQFTGEGWKKFEYENFAYQDKAE